MGETLAVVIPTLNGAGRLPTVLRALRSQRRPADEIFVVDDGSSDSTSDVARSLDVTVLRHDRNQGAAAARNSGIDACRSTIVAFLDDDCEPDPEWAAELLAQYEDGVVGVGGAVIPTASVPYIRRYLRRHNPLQPLERELEESRSLWFRLWLYVRRQFKDPIGDRVRDVYAFAGANMSFRRVSLVAAGKLDPSLYYGGEDTELCRRIIATSGGTVLRYAPAASIVHHFDSSLRAVLRRSRVYGRASAWLYLRDPSGVPTFFPGPSLCLVGVAVLATTRFRALIPVVPHLLYPHSVMAAISGQLDALLDPYLQALNEAAHNVGFLAAVARRLHSRAGRPSPMRVPGAPSAMEREQG